jgi:hypothetical protein
MSKTVTDLREHLFATLAGLRTGTVSIETAKAISDVSQTIINSAKVEVEYARLRDDAESTFLSGGSKEPELPNGIKSIVRHRIQG